MDKDTLKQIKQDIMDGKVTLRSAALQHGIDRDKLREMLEGEMTQQAESERFRERMKLNRSSSSIPLDEQMEEMVTSILKGEITAKEASEKYHIYTETIRRKIDEFVQKDPQYLKLYFAYRNKSAIDYGNINFKGLIVYMLRHDMSQSEIAEEYGIPARTVSREVEKLGESEEEKDIKLYNIAKICADRKMRKQKLSRYEMDLYAKVLDELFPNIPVINFDDKTPTELEIERLEKFLAEVQMYHSQNMTAEQVAQKMGTSVSTIRRNKLKLEELKRQEAYRKEVENLNVESPDMGEK